MSKFGINLPSIGNVAVQVANSHPDATKNRAGGLSYTINDPATKLLTMTGGQLFNEPSYYANDKVGVDGLGELARDVVATARSVANSDSPQDLLSLAHYLRVEKKIRTTPAVLFAIAAGEAKNRDRLVEYAPKVLRRADEVLQAFAAYFALYGTFGLEQNRVVRKAILPNSFKKALSAAISKFDEYQLVKYENQEWPRWKDVVQLVERKKNYPVKKEMLDYFITSEVVNAQATPILAARKELNALTEWNDDVPALAKRAHIQWDMLLSSKIGSKNPAKVWEAMIDGGRTTLPTMAAVRNLRNMEDAGISRQHWDKLRAQILADNDNKMMPFRFIAARKNTKSRDAISVADALLDKACDNMADLEGITALVADHSGSMDKRISHESEMTKKEAATALLAVMAKKLGTRARVGTFGHTFSEVEFSLSDSAYRIYEEIMKIGRTTGVATNAWLMFKAYTQMNIHIDRLVLLSDMQCYNTSSLWYQTDNVGKELQSAFLEYKAKVNPNCKLISVDVGGYGQSVSPTTAGDVYLSTGYTEGIINEIVQWEKGIAETPKGEAVSTTASMDFVRANF